MTFTHKIFGPMLMAAGVPPQGTTAVLLASSQVDWFGPFPSSDMFGQMGLAQSTHLKYMLYNGWAIVVANIILLRCCFSFWCKAGWSTRRRFSFASTNGREVFLFSPRQPP